MLLRRIKGFTDHHHYMFVLILLLTGNLHLLAQVQGYQLNQFHLVLQTRVLQYPIKKQSYAEMRARRDKELCYNCDEVFSAGHKYVKQQLFMLAADKYEGTTSEVTSHAASIHFD